MKYHLKVKVNANMFLNYACRVNRSSDPFFKVEVYKNVLSDYITSGMACSLEQAQSTVKDLFIREIVNRNGRVQLILDHGDKVISDKIATTKSKSLFIFINSDSFLM